MCPDCGSMSFWDRGAADELREGRGRGDARGIDEERH